MMAEKAILFNDLESWKKITDRLIGPFAQKKLGRMVKGFNKDEWEKVARDIVFSANYAKFTQHPDLLKQLLETENKIIVEASPIDCIWGIGMSCDDPGIEDPKNWRGTNWLGEAIMIVREHIRNESK
jgi:ribA/ribD-fused uncharacterized protein